MLGGVRTAINHAIVEQGLNIPNIFTNLRIKGAGANKLDRLPLSDTQVVHLEPAHSNDTTAWALFVCLRDTGCRVSEITGLRVKDCDTDKGCLIISPTPWRTLKTNNSQRSVPLSQEAIKSLEEISQGKDPEAPLFSRYAKEREGNNCSAMLMKRLKTIITGKKLTMHSLRHHMKDKLRNKGCPKAISMAILRHGSNTVAANYGSGYALDVMREHMEKVWA
jgi:integrase